MAFVLQFDAVAMPRTICQGWAVQLQPEEEGEGKGEEKKMEKRGEQYNIGSRLLTPMSQLVKSMPTL